MPAPYPQQGYPPPPPYPYAYPPPTQLAVPDRPWRETAVGFAVTSTVLLGLGAGIALLAKQYLVPLITGETAEKKLQREQQEKRRLEEAAFKAAKDAQVMEELLTTLKSLQSQSTQMKELVSSVVATGAELRAERERRSMAPPRPMSDSERRTLSELEAENKILKAMAMDRKAFSGSSSTFSPTNSDSWAPAAVSSVSSGTVAAPAAKPSIPSWQTSSNSNPYTYEDPYNKSKDRVSSSPPSTTPAPKEKDEPAHPKDFGRIIEMVQNGQTPPDIRDINDKPLDPNYKFEPGQRPTPVKSYQQAQRQPSDRTWSEVVGDAGSAGKPDSPVDVPRVEEVRDSTPDPTAHEQQ
eukprot:TRINITY_DN3018_c0_g2_i1.p1 TRINITY_DN3018_c0_g2~~TRINITY_DN3018_c0_g2_i1.p1  ORF type:complete len:351 (+),score=154.50 TRINITY_DN3018_c0_g2_i1:402-1454(+)